MRSTPPCKPPSDPWRKTMAKKSRKPAEPKRVLLTDRQCHIAVTAIREFGYPVDFSEIRKIADEVAAGTHSMSDPVARIIASQIDEADEMRKEAGLPPLEISDVTS